MVSNLRPDEIKDLYCTDLSETEILSSYPCDKGTFKKSDYDSPELTITFDTHTAYYLRMKKVPVVVWGKKYKNNHRAYVFAKARPQALAF